MAKSLNLLLTLLFTYPAYSCIIHGTDSGYCDFRYHAQYYEGTQSQLVKTQKMENDFGRVIARNFQTEAHNFWGGPMKNGGECTSELGHGLNIEALTADIRSPRQERETAAPGTVWDNSLMADILQPMNALNASTDSRYFDSSVSKTLGDHCMPFCGPFLLHEIRDEEYNFPGFVPCVPRDQSLPVDRNFPQGRHTKHTTKSKDAWVELAVNAWMIRRKLAETDELDMEEVTDEYGVLDTNDGGATALRFTKGKVNQACEDAFSRYMCSINFPRCDENQESLRTCESTCINMFYTCGMSSDLYRCGSSDFFNGGLGAELPGGGGTAEVPSLPRWVLAAYQAMGGTVNNEPGMRYWRDYFPGQPFKVNEFVEGSEEQEPIAVCTPSIKGAGGSRFASMGAIIIMAGVGLISSLAIII